MSSSLHLCWARGALRPRTDVRPALDERAFRYGDGVFTTLSLSRGRLLDAALHMKRLRRSASAIGLSVPDSVDTASSLARILASMGVDGSTDGVVRIQLSAGAGGRGYGRDRSADAWELVEVLAPPGARSLTVAILAEEEAPVPALPHVKSCSSLAHVMCAMAADRRGVTEAVRTGSGHLLEAAAANLFWLVDGELFTPSATLPIYPGVTRSVVLETARELMELAEAERRQAVDLYQFTSLITARYDEGQRMVLAEVMWRVVYADGELAKHESYLIRKLSHLLGLKPGYLAEARKRAVGRVD